jgi:hypothetical protein
VSFDAAKQSCSVQPISSVRLADTEISLPVLDDVPFCFPRAGGFTLVLPVAAGDVVTLLFTDRMLDGWRGSGRAIAPTDPRSHALADAFAVPLGMWPDAELSQAPSWLDQPPRLLAQEAHSALRPTAPATSGLRADGVGTPAARA